LPIDRSHIQGQQLGLNHEDEVAMIERDQRIVKSTTEAREGVTGHNVRYVLIVSLVGVVLVFGALWLYFFA
jgi:hypothetical protein